ncbi:MAG: hypothetical protein ACTSRP_27170, partial [Candidatus Helarchaeota archaeon]
NLQLPTLEYNNTETSKLNLSDIILYANIFMTMMIFGFIFFSLIFISIRAVADYNSDLAKSVLITFLLGFIFGVIFKIMTLCNNLNLLITTFILDPIFSLLGIFAGIFLSALIIHFCLKINFKDLFEKIKKEKIKKFISSKIGEIFRRFFISFINTTINFIFGVIWKGQIPTDKINDLKNKIFAVMVFVGLASFILGIATSLLINDDGRKLLKNFSLGAALVMILAFFIIVKSVIYAWIYLITGSSYENKQITLLVLINLIMLIFLF